MTKSTAVTTEKFKNGLTLVKIPMPGVISVAVLALVGVGSRYDTLATAGLAHFYEHLVVMGTRKYPTNFEFTHKIEEVGADFNAFTAEEFTGFYVKTEGRHLPMALEMISQLITQPLLKETEIKREQLVILEEIKMREDNPGIKVHDRLTEIMFSGNGLGIPGAGTAETVTSFKREDFQKLQKQHYVGNNTILVIAGNIHDFTATKTVSKSASSSISPKKSFPKKSDQQIIQLVDKYFSNFSAGIQSIPDQFSGNKQPKTEIIHKSVDQVHLAIGFPTFSRKHPQRYALNLLAVILGSGFTSRLFQKIRQQNSLAYSIGADVELFSDVGQFTISAGVDRQRLKLALAEIFNELEAVKGKNKQHAFPITKTFESRPITKRELRKAKDYLRGKLALRLEDPLNLAMYYGGQQLLDKNVLTWPEVLEKIEQVTIKDIQEIARQIFKPEKINLVVIGKKLSSNYLKNLI